MSYEIKFEEPSDALLDHVARLTLMTAIPVAYFTDTEATSAAESERAWRALKDELIRHFAK